MISVPVYFLLLPARGRRYEFQPRSDGTVRVRRTEGQVCNSQRDLPVGEARALYRRLVKAGYTKW